MTSKTKVKFSDAKTLALLGIFEHLHQSDGAEWVEASEVVPFVQVGLSAAFVNRVLTSLVTDGLVDQGSSNHTEFPIFRITDKGIITAEGILEKAIDGELAPASDRIVSFSDNQKADIDSKIDDLLQEIQSSNEVRSKIADDVDRISAELKASKELISVSHARLSALIAVLVRPLRYLVEKFGDGIVGALASQLLEELMKAI